jgi:Ca2+ transporting ATPase
MTCEGQILAAVEDKPNETTPLQDKLDIIAIDIGKLGMYAAILIVHCLLLRNFVEGMIRKEFDLFGGEMNLAKQKECNKELNCCILEPGHSKGCDTLSPPVTCPKIGEDEWDNVCDGKIKSMVKGWLAYLIVGVAIIVVAVPEGLPLAVMISLAYSVSKMLKDQNFVKRLTSCEIMGGANNICSDKTGTLTKNQMTWTQIWCGHDKKIEDPDGTGSIDTNSFCTNKKHLDLIKQGVSCNTEGTVADGSATEVAMLKFIQRCDTDFHYMREHYTCNPMIRFPFDSSRKRMSTVIELDEDDETEHGFNRRLHTKGASEIVLETCSHYIDANGDRQVLDDQIKGNLDDIIKSYAVQALRTIGFAYRDLEKDEGGPEHEEKEEGSRIYKVEEGGLTLVCIAGIKDIIREEVPGAVKQCNQAGVRVRMVTGDNLVTAIAIGKECGILDANESTDNQVCMTGPDFHAFVGGLVHKDTKEQVVVLGKEPDKEEIGDIKKMEHIRKNLKVLARSRPNDKYIMVAGLRQLGDIVAVTGDGTNDAPALRKADVGFAMNTGTQVAHTAADIIIQDDNFASIVKACKWGRNVYDNIRRFLQFQLTVNVVALITSFIGSVIMWESPLAAIQLLWVNLIMDSLASLALATEEPKEDLLRRPPYRKKEYIISPKMVKHILGMSIYQAIVLFVFVFAGFQFVSEKVDYREGGVESGAVIEYDPLSPPSKANLWAKGGINVEVLKKHPSWAACNSEDEAVKSAGCNIDFFRPLIFNGMVSDFQGNVIYQPLAKTTYSRHLSIIFNMFVLFQIFNMLAARKINDEFNIFEGMCGNAMFVGVWIIILVAQIAIVNLGGKIFKVHAEGITLEQWVWCLAFGFSSLIWNAVLKKVPESICPVLGDEDLKDVEAASADYKQLRKSMRNFSGSAKGSKFVANK